MIPEIGEMRLVLHNADVDADGIYDELEIEGCTDPQACNYNPMATMDSGNCEYVEVILE